MTLVELIRKLGQAPGALVRTDSTEYPYVHGAPSPYVDSTADLALSPGSEPVTVERLESMMIPAVDANFEGPDGLPVKIGADAGLWLAHVNEKSGIQIIGATLNGNTLTLNTRVA